MSYTHYNPNSKPEPPAESYMPPASLNELSHQDDQEISDIMTLTTRRRELPKLQMSLTVGATRIVFTITAATGVSQAKVMGNGEFYGYVGAYKGRYKVETSYLAQEYTLQMENYIHQQWGYPLDFSKR